MAYKHVDADSSGGGDGSTWALSGGSAAYTLAEFYTWAAASVAAGDTIFIKKATAAYTGVADLYLGAKDGTSTSLIKIIGVKEATTNTGANIVYSDWAVLEADKQLIDIGAYTWTFGQYWSATGWGLTSSDPSYAIYFNDINCTFENISCENTGNGAAFYSTKSDIRFINCYGKAPNSIAFRLNINNYMRFCHADGSASGIVSSSSGSKIDDCIVSDCTTGIDLVDDNAIQLVGVTIDDCTTGIAGTTAYNGIMLNTTISNCTDGWKFNNSGTIITSTYMDYNNWYNNTRDMSWDNGSTEDNSGKGSNDIAVDPDFTDAAGDDYSLGTTDCKDGGKSMILGVG